MTKFIFITGGVVSSLGKGIVASSLGALLQAHGYSVRIRKMDPYLNVDPGTMSPLQHGEVFVTEDGAETDLDLGHYERFTGVNSLKNDNITSGRIYQEVISRERQGGYLGATVQVIPHITDAIKTAIVADSTQQDFVLVEIGGTVGDIESLPFLEAIRQLANELGHIHTMFVHVTLLPWIASSGELKTKPTQHSVRQLLGLGIAAQMLVCRTDREIPPSERKKISLFCNVTPEAVISACDVDDIHQVPVVYHQAGIDRAVLKHFDLPYHTPNLDKWHKIIKARQNPQATTCIGIVGKYVNLKDSYKSLTEAIAHAGIANSAQVNIKWIDSEQPQVVEELEECSGILVPGGFGSRGIEGKLAAISYSRASGKPFLGICLGMQLSVIEALRSVGYSQASSTEFGPCQMPVVDVMVGRNGELGGTMRLGNYPAMLSSGTRIRQIYNEPLIHERHRHRYEVIVDQEIKTILEDFGMVISAYSPDGQLPEIVERTDHPWFFGVQFHPELTSRPWQAHPIFVDFIRACLDTTNTV